MVKAEVEGSGTVLSSLLFREVRAAVKGNFLGGLEGPACGAEPPVVWVFSLPLLVNIC